MTRLLLGVLLLVNLEASVTAPAAAAVQALAAPVQALAAPPQAQFNSVDYKNVLHWTPPTNSSGLRYHVQWKIYGEPEWLDVSGCQGIRDHQCDLSGVTSDLREWYYGRVRASSGSGSSAWVSSPRFSPRWDTKLSPPVLKLHVTERGIVVRVKPPRPLVQKLHASLQFRVYLKLAGGEEVAFQLRCCSDRLLLGELDPKSQYCLQAQTSLPLQAKSSARSTARCVSTL